VGGIAFERGGGLRRWGERCSGTEAGGWVKGGEGGGGGRSGGGERSRGGGNGGEGRGLGGEKRGYVEGWGR